MKIKLLMDVPVAKEHGMFKGRIFEIIKDDRPGIWVMGDAEEPVKLHSEEYEFLKNE